MSPSFAQVGVVFGGPSPEHDVSILTGLQATHELMRSKQATETHAIYWAKNGGWFVVSSAAEPPDFLNGPPRNATALDLRVGPEGGFYRRNRFSSRGDRLDLDAVVICCHGGPGEDGTLQSALDLAGVAYTGPNSLGAALGMDKLATSAIVQAAALPALARVLFDSSTPQPEFPAPYIVKPRSGGSSIGIDVVVDFATAQARLSSNVHLRNGAILEPYRPELFDLQVAVRTWPVLQLSEIERPLRKSAGPGILDFADKYAGSEGMASAARELPANISEELASKLRECASRVAAIFDVRGVARIDFLSDGTSLYVNEVNTIPGSLSRYLFIKPVVAFDELLVAMVNEAIERPAATYTSAGADGKLLQQSASIASKLG